MNEHLKKSDGSLQKSHDSFTYLPPSSVLLEQLGIAASDLQQDKVLVDASALHFLISEFARRAKFDPEWYAFSNPDVEGARLAGDVASLHEHFLMSGYLEGRLPSMLPFDPAWYHSHYEDIASTFRAADVEGMRNHFLTKGYFEGRAGTEGLLAATKFWFTGS